MKQPAAVLLAVLTLISSVSGGSSDPDPRADLPPQRLAELVKLTAADAAAQDRFGWAVAVSGTTVAVAAESDGSAGFGAAGSVYVFERHLGGTDNWGLVKEIFASDPDADDSFGYSVALDGDTLVAGAWEDDGAATNAGAIYVFGRDQGGADNWGEVKKLTTSDAGVDDRFGVSVGIDGDTIIAGAHIDDGAATDAGAAYLFERNQGGPDNWGEVKKLTASDAAASDFFGFAVAISGDSAVAGAWENDDAGSRTGSAYVFERDQGGPDNWGEVKKLTASDAAMNARFGEAVTIDGDTVAVGATGASAAASGAGAVYVFARDQGGIDNWGEVRQLTASDAQVAAALGISVSVAGDVLGAGAFLLDTVDFINVGAAYLFERDQGGADNWGEVEKLTASDGVANDNFGFSISVSGDAVVVGAHRDDGVAADTGSAYVFGTPGPNLVVPTAVPTSFPMPVAVPVILNSNGATISAITFSVDYDESCLAFDPSDVDLDGIPDDVVFSLPPDFLGSVTFSAGDTDGELDFAIADFIPPLAVLPDGILATITLTPICAPAGSSIFAPVGFSSDPTASFGGTSGQSIAGTTLDGSVEILPGTSGDCNGDGVVDAGDLSACVLEVFDGDGSFWGDAAGGTFPGNPVGCDANQDTLIDAGDVSCKILLIFNGPGACGTRTPGGGESGPVLTLKRRFGDGTVYLPIHLRARGRAINSLLFSIDYDESTYAFDPADDDRDGVPDAVRVHLSRDVVVGVTLTPSDRDGELDVMVLDPGGVLDPGAGTMLLTLTLERIGRGAVERPAGRFAKDPPPSFGDLRGRSIAGTAWDH